MKALKIISVGLLCLILLFIYSHSSWKKRRDADRLQKLFPTFEKFRVEAYRNQNWCKNISYIRGHFSNNNQAFTCNLFREKAQNFGVQAWEDWKTIRKTLGSSGVSVRWFSANYNEEGRVKYAEFELRCFFCRLRYVFEPLHEPLPADLEREIYHTWINKDWYFVDEDWN